MDVVMHVLAGDCGSGAVGMLALDASLRVLVLGLFSR